jgi:eukaryotic-like serine/threonine-protein kinase
MIGQALAHYQILEMLGEGGMGVVYKARDTHLDRFVAIKVLPPGKTADAERKRRFILEAKAASALNHPSIVTVHDIASDGGQDYIVMELVEGRTLDEVIAARRPKLADVLSWGAQVADGLAKAHAAGIVHRDLKPSNIMVGDEGRVKILDFGLAKLTETIQGDRYAPTQAIEKDGQLRTGEGVIVGTVSYMSPEQAEGLQVDARSDVFSFGSVLYEMLTGQRAFHRGSVVSTLNAITSEDPKPPSAIVESIPREVEQVVSRCLRKDPQRRFQTMSDLRAVLLDLKEESESGKLRAAPRVDAPSRRVAYVLPISIATLAVAVAALLGWLYLRGRTPAETQFAVKRLTFDAGLTTWPAISADGTLAAYVSDRDGNADIWVQQIASGKALRRTNSPETESGLSFSPDGSKIAYRGEHDGGGIFVIDTLEGEPVRLAERGVTPRFSPDGSRIAYVEVPASAEPRHIKLRLVASQGGAAVDFRPEFAIAATSLGSGPVWSPDGSRLLFRGWLPGTKDSHDWWVVPIGGGAAVRTGATKNLDLGLTYGYPTAWVGDFVYYEAGTVVEGINLYRVRIDPRSFETAGPAERLTSGASTQAYSSVSRDGHVLFSDLTIVMNVWSLRGSADAMSFPGPSEPITADRMSKYGPRVTRDGSRVVFTAFRGRDASQQVEVRVRDLATGRETAIPIHGVFLGPAPVPSADGGVLAYRDMPEGRVALFVLRFPGGTPRRVCDSCEVGDFFSDPNWAVVEEEGRIVRRNLETGESARLLELGSRQVHFVTASADDRWLAFAVAAANGDMQLAVSRVGTEPQGEDAWIVMASDDRYLTSPGWSPDGRVLYWLAMRAGRCAIWARRFDPESGAPVGEPVELFHPSEPDMMLNVPRANGVVSVAPDRLVFYLAEVSGNIYSLETRQR